MKNPTRNYTSSKGETYELEYAGAHVLIRQDGNLLRREPGPVVAGRGISEVEAAFSFAEDAIEKGWVQSSAETNP